MRKPMMAGNWKMSKTLGESIEFVQAIRPLVAQYNDVDIVVCPPFVSLQAVSEALRGANIAVGAQNVHWDESGAWTGEVSARMLEGIVGYVIIGHSERRQHFADTDELVNKKIKAALAHQLTPIVCVGENLKQREAGVTETLVRDQVQAAFDGLDAEQAASIVVAYEPIWAIGTGLSATPEMANQVCGPVVRGALAGLYGEDVAQKTRVLYGGSANEKNIGDLMAMPDIDGALIGGASIKIDSFVDMVRITSEQGKQS